MGSPGGGDQLVETQGRPSPPKKKPGGLFFLGFGSEEKTFKFEEADRVNGAQVDLL